MEGRQLKNLKYKRPQISGLESGISGAAPELELRQAKQMSSWMEGCLY